MSLKNKNKTQEYPPTGKINLNNYALRTYQKLVQRSQCSQGNYLTIDASLKQKEKKSANRHSPTLSFYLVPIPLL